MKLTHFLIFISLLLTACVERGKVEVSGLESATPNVTDVSVKDGKLHLKGSALHSAKKVRIDDTSLQIESQNESSLVASATEALSLTTSAVFDLVISNAQGSSTYPIQLVISDGDVTTAKLADGSVTASKLDDMGATTGQILKYNGSEWTVSDLGNLTYSGNWDADSNDPDLTGGGVPGEYHIVNVAGTYDLNGGPGTNDWAVGDWVIWNETKTRWEKINNASNVTSFAGRSGPVVPESGDYTWDQIDKATAPIDDLSDVDTSTVTGGDVLKWDGSNWIPQADDDSGGDITEVNAGTGLTGGGTSGSVTLDVDAGTSANQIPQLDSSGLLLNSVIPELDTSKITSGVMDQARLPYASDLQDGIITASEHQKLNSTDTTLSGGAAGEYLDGDGNWYVLDNAAVGLGNVTNDQQIPLSNLDTNTSLGTSDTLVPSQNAVKTYVDDSVSTASNDYLLRDGTQAMTGNFDGGGNNLTNVGSLTTNNQAGATLNPFGTNAGETGEIRFMELAANGSNYLGFKAPDALSANQIWRLPGSDGASGEALVTDGSGVLSWAGSLPPSGGAGGELSGSYPDPTIADGVIDSANLMTDSVTSAEIAADAVGTSEIATDGVNSAEIAADAVGTSEIATDGVDSAEIATGAVNTDELATSSVTSGKIADGEILNADVNASADIAATKLGTGVVDNTEFNYLDGLTGDIQTQLDSKVDLAGDTMTGALAVPADGLTVGTSQITTNGGSVGVGTASPSRPFHTLSGDDHPGLFESSDGRSFASFKDSGTTSDNSVAVGAVNDSLYFRSGGADRMVMDSAGNVGVGTSTPSEKLEVTGEVKSDVKYVNKASHDISSTGWYRVAEMQQYSGLATNMVFGEFVAIYDAGCNHGIVKFRINRAQGGSNANGLSLDILNHTLHSDSKYALKGVRLIYGEYGDPMYLEMNVGDVNDCNGAATIPITFYQTTGTPWTFYASAASGATDLSYVREVGLSDPNMNRHFDRDVSFGGNVDMNNNNIDNATIQNSNIDDQFYWAVLSIDTLEWEDSTGASGTLSSRPGSNSVVCSGGSPANVCLGNHGDSHYDIGFHLKGVSSKSSVQMGQYMCWAVAPGDNEGPHGNNPVNVAGIGMDINGGMAHMVDYGSPPDTNETFGIETSSLNYSSHESFGVVCLK